MDSYECNTSLLPPGELIERELKCFLYSWGKYSLRKPVVLLFPPGLSAVMVKNIRYQASMLHLECLYITVENRIMVAVCRKQCFKDGLRPAMSYAYEDSEPLNESHLQKILTVSVDNAVWKKGRCQLEAHGATQSELDAFLQGEIVPHNIKVTNGTKLQSSTSKTIETDDTNTDIRMSNCPVYNHVAIIFAKSLSAFIKQMYIHHTVVNEKSEEELGRCNNNIIKAVHLDISIQQYSSDDIHRNIIAAQAESLGHILQNYYMRYLYYWEILPEIETDRTASCVYKCILNFKKHHLNYSCLIPIILQWKHNTDFSEFEIKYFLNEPCSNMNAKHPNVLTYTLNGFPFLKDYTQQVQQLCGDNTIIVLCRSSFTPYRSQQFKFNNIVELYNFPSTYKRRDLLKLFKTITGPKHIKWCDDTHALMVFSTSTLADIICQQRVKNVKCRALRDGSPIATVIACRYILATNVPFRRLERWPHLDLLYKFYKIPKVNDNVPSECASGSNRKENKPEVLGMRLNSETIIDAAYHKLTTELKIEDTQPFKISRYPKNLLSMKCHSPIIEENMTEVIFVTIL